MATQIEKENQCTVEASDNKEPEEKLPPSKTVQKKKIKIRPRSTEKSRSRTRYLLNPCGTKFSLRKNDQKIRESKSKEREIRLSRKEDAAVEIEKPLSSEKSRKILISGTDELNEVKEKNNSGTIRRGVTFTEPVVRIIDDKQIEKKVLKETKDQTTATESCSVIVKECSVVPGCQGRSKSFSSIESCDRSVRPFMQDCTLVEPEKCVPKSKNQAPVLRKCSSDTTGYNVNVRRDNKVTFPGQRLVEATSDEKFFDAEAHPIGFQEKVEEIIENYISKHFISLHKNKDYDLIIVPRDRSYVLTSYSGKMTNKRKYISRRKSGLLPDTFLWKASRKKLNRRSSSGVRSSMESVETCEKTSPAPIVPQSIRKDISEKPILASNYREPLKNEEVPITVREPRKASKSSVTVKQDSELECKQKTRIPTKLPGSAKSHKIPDGKDMGIKNGPEKLNYPAAKERIKNSELFAELDKLKSMFREVEKKHDSILSIFCNDPCGLALEDVDAATTFDSKVNILLR